MTKQCDKCIHWQPRKDIDGSLIGRCEQLENYIWNDIEETSEIITDPDFYCSNWKEKLDTK